MFVPAQAQTLQEKLGYSKNAKLLILHADDLGMTHSTNVASIYAMERGCVNSASIMVPCPWFPEIAAYARKNPGADFGLHLTLTSEWKYLKWRPILSNDDVPGLVNNEGFFYSTVDSLHRSAPASEVKKELKAQIDRALSFGIDVTHLDSHMAALFGHPDYLKVLISLGREYRVPVLLSKQGFRSAFNADVESFITERDVMIDMIFTANPEDFRQGMANFYVKVLKQLQPGVSVVLMHTSYDDREMKATTIDHPDWGSAWRQADFDFFTSPECQQLLKEHNIQLITWREIRDKIVRK